MAITQPIVRWLALLCWPHARCCVAFALVLCWDQAQADEVIHIRSAILQPLDGTETRTVALPDAWNTSGRSGTWVYRMEFSIASSPSQSWGLYVPRTGNRAVLYLNDLLIGELGRLDGDASDHAQRPHYFFVRAETLIAGRNELRIVVQGEKARYAGLSRLEIGPVDLVYRSFAVRETLQVWGSFAIILISVVFALIATVLAGKTKDRAFAIFAAACVFCAFRTSYAVVVNPPFDYRLWTAAIDASYAAYLVCLCIFCADVLALHRRWTNGATVLLIIGASVLVPLYAWWRAVSARQLLLSLMILYATSLCVAVIVKWWMTRSLASAYLASAGAVSIALAIYDHVTVFYTADGYSTFAAARYSLLIFVLAMGALLVDRFVKQLEQETRLRADVERQVLERTHEIELHFDRQQAIAAQRVQKQERQHLMEDLHDGMGLQLHGLLGLVQSGSLERNQLAREVRTAIEQMRLLLESAEGFDGDVSLLLGDIRYRIEQRLQRQGIRLDWSAKLEQPQRILAPQHAIALQRLVFELVTNTLKHSGAQVVTLSILDDPTAGGGLHLSYADDGCGYEADQARAGVGTRSIQRRVSDLGAEFAFTAAQGSGVHIRLSIPANAFL
ncbi:MAG: hypothetical protein RET84_02630 [Pseudomonadota bacterium]|nr:hypothetical protein [Pseudomonadota bacterium]